MESAVASLPVSPVAFAVLFAAVAFGALVQGTIGFGINVIAAPVAAIVQPDALPSAMIVLALPMTAGSAWREREHIDREGVLWSTLGRLPGVALGGFAVSRLEPEALASWIGGFVIVAALMSITPANLRVTPLACALVGSVAGVMGTMSSVGGPPLALLYQRKPGPVLRSTLGVTFLIGSLLSIGALALAGRVAPWHWGLGLALTPAVALGLFASRSLHARVDAGLLRPAIVAFACLAGLALLLSGCTVPRHTAPHHTAPKRAAPPARTACLPEFPDRGGWMGGDAAVSVAVPGGDGRKSLWFFGDSFVTAPNGSRPTSERAETAARNYPFAHNSVAVSRCDADGRFSIEYAWGRIASRTPTAAPGSDPVRAFFEPDPAAAWVEAIRRETDARPYYWPLAAVAFDDAVWVALLRVAPAQASGPFALPFRPVGVDLARIANPADPPKRWRIRIATLSHRADVLPASAFAIANETLHVFAFLPQPAGRSPRILIRIPLATLTEHFAEPPTHSSASASASASVPSSALSSGSSSHGPSDARPAERNRPELEQAFETLGADGRWLPGIVPERARILMTDDASEMTVHFEPTLGRWLAVYVDPTQEPLLEDARPRPGDAILLRQAVRLEGPWSEPLAVFAMPEAAVGDDPPPGRPFCYAGRAHPQFARPGELLLTWVCNVYAESPDEVAGVLERLRTSPGLYRPHAVRVPFQPTD